MKARTIRCTCLGFFALLAAGCASTTYEGPRSGFLPADDYALLKKMDAPGGGIRYAYISDRFTPENYTAVMIDRLQYFPEPQPDSIVPGDTLSQIRDFADAELHAKLGAKVMVVNEPGPGVARVKVAITAVSAEKRDLKAYQYIPIALVLTLSKWAITGRPDDSTVAFEGEVTDSVTHAPLLISIRGGTGEALSKDAEGQKKVALDDFKALLDKWAEAASADFTKYVRAK